jgi:two-component system, NarL family, invasion response regulator UvrY
VSADELELALQTVYAGQRYLSPELAGVAGLQAAPAEGAATMPTEAAALQSLSARELQILMLVVQGSSSSSIGLQLGLSPKTIESYRSRLMDKLALADVTALVRWAVRNGLLSAN